MNAHKALLEIQVHLSDNNIACFRQSNPEVVQGILAHLQPDKIFTQRQLILADDHSVTVYPCSAVARVDFVMEGYPNWPFHRNVTDIVEITRDEFQARYDPQTLRAGRRFLPGETACAFGEMELANGQSIFREVHYLVPPSEPGQERLPMDRNVFFHQLFTAPSLHMRRRGGGGILINPAHLLRVTFYPGPSDVPENAWNVNAA